MEIKGILKSIKGKQAVSDKFVKREFILLDNSSKYEQYISFQASQNNCDQLDQFTEGEYVTVHFNLKGREWTSPQGEIKYFNTLDAWKVEREANQNTITPPPTQSGTTTPFQENEKTFVESSNRSDLPF